MVYTVATFNIKRESSAKAKKSFQNRAESVKDFFDKVSPDILGTQELTESALEILEKTKHISQKYERVGEPRTLNKKGEYTAIFFKKELFELIESDTFWLSRSPKIKGSRSWLSLFPRTCTWCILKPKGGGDLIRVYNTHLDCFSPFARLRGISLIKRFAEKYDSDRLCGTVIMGDFNARPSSKTVKTLTQGEQQTVVKDTFSVLYRIDPHNIRTYHGFKGKKKGTPIDYIFTTKKIDILSAHIDRTTYAETYPSDHFPVIAKLEIKE